MLLQKTQLHKQEQASRTGNAAAAAAMAATSEAPLDAIAAGIKVPCSCCPAYNLTVQKMLNHSTTPSTPCNPADSGYPGAMWLQTLFVNHGANAGRPTDAAGAGI